MPGRSASGSPLQSLMRPPSAGAADPLGAPEPAVKRQRLAAPLEQASVAGSGVVATSRDAAAAAEAPPPPIPAAPVCDTTRPSVMRNLQHAWAPRKQAAMMVQQAGTLLNGGTGATKQQRRQRQPETKAFRLGSSLKRSLRSPMVSESPAASRQPRIEASMCAAPEIYAQQPRHCAAVPGEACLLSWCRGDHFDACWVPRLHGRLDCLAPAGTRILQM